jgi:Uma2 family endonuclease
MGTTTKLTLDEWLRLPEREGTIYELDEGELLMEPSPALSHNRIRDRIARCLADFVQHHRLGEVTVETDFRLGPATVRNPDVAFIAAEHLKQINPEVSPLEGAPALAVEVVSPSNSAQDMRKKVSQYLSAGSKAVWVVYPNIHLVEIHQFSNTRKVVAPDTLSEEELFPDLKFSMSLAEIFRD